MGNRAGGSHCGNCLCVELAIVANSSNQQTSQNQGGDVFTQTFGGASLNKKSPLEIALYALFIVVAAVVAIMLFK